MQSPLQTTHSRSPTHSFGIFEKSISKSLQRNRTLLLPAKGTLIMLRVLPLSTDSASSSLGRVEKHLGPGPPIPSSSFVELGPSTLPWGPQPGLSHHLGLSGGWLHPCKRLAWLMFVFAIKRQQVWAIYLIRSHLTPSPRMDAFAEAPWPPIPVPQPTSFLQLVLISGTRCAGIRETGPGRRSGSRAASAQVSHPPTRLSWGGG